MPHESYTISKVVLIVPIYADSIRKVVVRANFPYNVTICM